jgi:hypothetical protein
VGGDGDEAKENGDSFGLPPPNKLMGTNLETTGYRGDCNASPLNAGQSAEESPVASRAFCCLWHYSDSLGTI